MCDSRSGSLRDEGQFSQGTVAQEGAAEGSEKQQTDYTRTSGLQPVRYRTKIAGWERANAGRATTVIPAPPDSAPPQSRCGSSDGRVVTKRDNAVVTE